LAHIYPTPGIRAVRRRELVKVTFATCRTAEFGFLGDIVATLLTIPLICGRPFKAGVLLKFNGLYFLSRTADCLRVAINTQSELKDESLSCNTESKHHKN
jgi:hypothetical protein